MKRLREKLISALENHGAELGGLLVLLMVAATCIVVVVKAAPRQPAPDILTGSYRVEIYDGGERTGAWSTERIEITPGGTATFVSVDDPDQPTIHLRANTLVITSLHE